MKRLAIFVLLASAPAAVFGESATPSIGYTGAPADHGGQSCITCHTGAAVNDPSGSLQVIASNYSPLGQQLIRIIVQNSHADRWGFQMTIRSQNSPAASAGTFSLAPNPGPVQIVCDNGTQYGSSTGCTTPLRYYAEHLMAPRGAEGAAYEFDVSWTPPEQEVGRVEVYVAAVAANGDDLPTGDYVYTSATVLQDVGVCNDTVIPTLNSAVNGATFLPPFSSLSMVSLLGTNFYLQGYTRTAGPGDYVNNAFPTELGCISIQADGPGLTNPVLLPLAYVDPTQINAQMPEFTGTGPVTLTVIANPGETNELRSTVSTLTALQNFAPSFFVFPNSKSVAAEEAATGAIVASPSVVAGASPAKPGDIVSLFGTGFGDTNPSLQAGALATGIATLTNQQITVTIGGTTLASSDVLYAGLSPGSIDGLYQFNVQIPADAPSGDVPVTISIGGVQTQAGATIPIQ
ncbi:MAG: choice-of-anchor V domain-containing protein [Bryobacteraceae bacterium]